MKRSNRLVLLVGVFLAIVAFVGIVLIFGNQGPDQPPPEAQRSPTVYAKQDIAIGTIVEASMVEVQDKLPAERSASSFGDVGLVIGKVARANIRQGAQLTGTDFQTTQVGVTTIDTPPGFVAMSIQVDQVSGVGTVIRAGDYVDLLVGFTGDKFPVIQPDPENEGTFTVVSGLNNTSVKLLLQGMQVLGAILPPPPAQQEGQPAQGEQGTTLTGQQEIVILAVTPQQSEIIKFAQLDGSISLVLRSPQEFQERDSDGNLIPPPPADTTGVVLRSLVDEYGVLVPQLVEAVLPNLEP